MKQKLILLLIAVMRCTLAGCSKSGSDENIFAEEVFGGAVPRNFFPAVEKGVNKSLESGLLAGFPVIGVKATLLDGAYHPVDSDEISFVNAAILSYKEAYEVNKDGRTGNKFLLKPTILEPIVKLVFFKALSLIKVSTLTPYFLAILYKVSPFLTV